MPERCANEAYSCSDIKADNIMFGLDDDNVFEKYEQLELQDPSPRKILDDHTVYTSRDLAVPKKWGAPVLCDFGSVVPGDVEHTEDIQPDIYRAPEVILEVPWSYEVDIWNAGCMVSVELSNSVHRLLTLLFLDLGSVRGRTPLHRHRSRSPSLQKSSTFSRNYRAAGTATAGANRQGWLA